MSIVVLDTDVASAAVRSRLPEQVKARLVGATVCITAVTLGELTKWTAVRDWGPVKLAHVEAWRRGVVVLPIKRDDGLNWGEIESRAQKRGRPHPGNDSWIAAVCITRRHPLITFNVKDFVDYADHEGLNLIDGGAPVRPS